MYSSPLAERVYPMLSRHQSMVLALMLLFLYIVLLQPAGDGLGKALFIVHMGLFIVWQPLVEGRQRLSLAGTAWLTVLVIAMTALLSGWLLLLWTMMLAAIVGGRVLLSGSPRQRWAHLLALSFLVLALLLLAVPSALVRAELPDGLRTVGHVLLPLLLFIVAILPAPQRPAVENEAIDFVNSVLVLLLLAVLVLGSLSSMVLFYQSYATALLQSLFGLGGVLLFLGWVWNPHLGFSGIESFVSRYLMSVGMPAEQWLQSLADLAMRENDPVRFVDAACVQLASRLPWIRRVDWRTESAEGSVGKGEGHRAEFRHQEVTITLITRYPLPPSLAWHANLLAQFLAEFYADKQRAQRLHEISYLQAVHETGARLTHDVKNLLQSLQTLVFAVEHAEAENSDEFRSLIRRQLPLIASRLNVTLDKLRAPGIAIDEQQLPLGQWWESMRLRYQAASWIRFDTAKIAPEQLVYTAILSSVVDNLIGNIEQKRAVEPAVNLTIALRSSASGICLIVCDDGSAIPKSIADELLRHPVNSQNGLGIGLYQSARLARQFGYEITLASNETGEVCFKIQLAKAGVVSAR